MMKILVIIFFVLSVVMFLLFFGLAVIIKVLGTVAGALGRKVQNELDEGNDADTVIDVTAEYTHSAEEKALMAAKSIATAFTSSDTINNDLGAIMPLFIDTMRRVRDERLKSALMLYKKDMGEINSIIRYNPNFFGYTNELLAQVTCGFERIVSQKGGAIDDFATGMVYASDYVLTYMIKLNDLADLAGMIGAGELKTELSLAIERLERLDWAVIVYPNHNKNNIKTLHEMASRVAERIQTYLQAKSYGVDNDGARDLHATLVETVEDLNKALANALDSVGSWDMIQAGAELEAMRKELKLRGLY